MKLNTLSPKIRATLPLLRLRQEGWTAIGLCVILGSAALGAIIASFVFETSSARESIPWYIVTVMLIPIAFVLTTWMKINDLHCEREGLNREEKRRLSRIVDEKLRQVQIGIIFYISSALFALFVILTGNQNPSILAWGVPVIGGLLAISLSSIGFLLAQIREVSKFVGTLKDRAESRKNKVKLRNRTSRAKNP